MTNAWHPGGLLICAFYQEAGQHRMRLSIKLDSGRHIVQSFKEITNARV